MVFIKTFEQISKKDILLAGGKGASLGEMARARIPVPPGFVVLASAFAAFLEHSDLDEEIQAVLDRLNFKDIDAVEHASEKIRDIINDAPVPDEIQKETLEVFQKLHAPLVAVRSSATAEDSSIASWAGELESYLNTTQKNLLENVKRCWSSLFTPRALVYRFEKKLMDQQVHVAVVVQKMVQSDVSGVIFTVHPVTKDRNQMIIEAAWGLGEAIVQGMVTPDSYVIDKKKCQIIDINTTEQKKMIVRGPRGTKEVPVPRGKQEKQKLSGSQILKLADIALRIEKHYKFPQDIEWAHEKGSPPHSRVSVGGGGKFWVVQSRPITTL